jgi:Tol biopolymer transport system component
MDPTGIKTVFTIYKIPNETNPPSFFRLDWSWGDKLTIQGFRSTRDPFFPGFVGDMTTGDILPFYLDNSIIDGSIPLISKDGRYVAFQSQGKLYVVRRDTVTSHNYFITPDSYVNVLDTKFQCNNLDWSPDSKQLASTCQTSGGVIISLYDLMENRFEDIFEYSEAHLGEIEEGLSWSSDGTMLAFALRYDYDGESPQVDIFVYHLDTESLNRITDTSNVSERNPDWYPGSRILTFTSTIGGLAEAVDSSLTFSTADGKCMKPLPNIKGLVYPSWSPDGSQLAYIDGWMEIKILDTSRFVPSDFLSSENLCVEQ